jgi:isoquinoline 1-oxidoreductase subunit beta
VHCGQVIDYNGAEKQITGAILDGLNAAWYGETQVENGAFSKTNFHQYPMLRMAEADFPIQVQFIESDAPPYGLGEMGYPNVAPALCNAIVAAAGPRIRKLPLGAQFG